MSNKRIIALTEKTTLEDGDFVAIDNSSGGTKKYKLKNVTGSGSGLTDDIKQALLQLAAKVAYIDDDGQDYYDDLEDALYPVTPPATLSSISCVYTQSGTVYVTDTLDSLKTDLVVTATYDDSSTAIVTTYTLSGTLTAGTSTITVSYGGKTDTFTVTVTEYTTSPVISTEGVCWSKTPPNTVSKEGFGITQWYEYEFTQEALEACQYWDSTNQYMSSNGWAGVKSCLPDGETYAAGYSWPASSNYKIACGENSVFHNHYSITRNSEFASQFARYNTQTVADNGISYSIPLLDKEYCYSYWYKPFTGSILPSGVSNGDIIFAGRYTPYYGLHNINEAPTLSSISAVFTQGQTVVTESTTLNELKDMLAVTANYDNNLTLPVNRGMYSLSGTLTTGVSTVTVTYGSKTTTFTVTVS